MESADKPGSVENNHSSRRSVAATLQQPTRQARGPRVAALRLHLPYLVLLRVGFAVPVCYQTRGALLPHHFTLT